MGRNEIRLRRHKVSSGRIAQHRNYGELMERHERDVRIRRIVKTFVYFLIIVALLIMFVIVRRWEQKTVNETPKIGLVSSKVAEVNKPEMVPAMDHATKTA